MASVRIQSGEIRSMAGQLSVGWRDKREIKISNVTPIIRKENGDIGERTFEDYDVELINPPMLRLREDLSV